MLYVILTIALLITAFVTVDILRNRHPLTQKEAIQLASKRQREYQLQQFQFCVIPRPANPDEKKAMKSTGEFVACDLDYYEAPSRLAGLLKYKKHEWIVFAFIARGRVVRLWWNKGPDGNCVRPLLGVDTVQTLFHTLELDAVAVLHNHPNSNPSRYRMNKPSDADLVSATNFHRKIVAMNGSLLEFICERGVPHLYYAAFADSVMPAETILAKVVSANNRSILSNYSLRKELSRSSIGDSVPGGILSSEDESAS